MLTELGKEIFGNALGSAPTGNPAAEISFLSNITDILAAQAFAGNTPDGQIYTTYALPVPNQRASQPPAVGVSNAEAAMVRALTNGHSQALPSGPERSIGVIEQAVGAVVTNLWAPLAASLDEIAIRKGLIPEPNELFTPAFRELAQAAELYNKLPNIVAQDERFSAQLEGMASSAVATVMPVRDFDPATGIDKYPPTPAEKNMAMTQARILLNEMVDNRGGIVCGSCGQTACGCGASDETILTPKNVADRIAMQAIQTNTGIARKAVADSWVQGKRQMAAVEMERLLKNKQIEIIDLKPKHLITAALLSDWKLIPDAILASLIPNESGKKGASIVMQLREPSLGGSSIFVNKGELGRRSDTDELPISLLTSWVQPTWQQVTSDTKGMRKRWENTEHGTIPEVGVVNLINPGDKLVHERLPIAVRFPAKEKPLTGGAAVLPMAVAAVQLLQDFVKNIQGVNAQTPPPLTDDELSARVWQYTTTTLQDNAVRPQVVAAMAIDRATTIINDSINGPQTLRVIAAPTLQKITEAELARDAAATQAANAGELQTMLKNLQVAFAFQDVVASDLLTRNSYNNPAMGPSSVWDRSDPSRPVLIPRSQVRGVKPGTQPEGWAFMPNPTKEIVTSMIDTSMERINALASNPEVWRQILSGDIEIEGVDRATIAKAMGLQARLNNRQANQ